MIAEPERREPNWAAGAEAAFWWFWWLAVACFVGWVLLTVWAAHKARLLKLERAALLFGEWGGHLELRVRELEQQLHHARRQ